MQLIGGAELHPSHIAFIVLAVIALMLLLANYFMDGLGMVASLLFLVVVFALGVSAAYSYQNVEHIKY
jgi:NADH:ubiquinone oxidoreductase subunit 3 (subunit A)